VTLICVGATYHHVDLDTLAALVPHATGIAQRLAASGGAVTGVVALATCNRFEFYVEADSFHGGVNATLQAIADSQADFDRALLDRFVIYAAQGAVEHLFLVAASLDSMVVGEAEIAGQVRDALQGAESTLTPPLRRLFQDALTTSKAVTSQAGLGSVGRSLASVGLDLAAENLPPWSDAQLLVVGTGRYAAIVVADLMRRGCAAIDVYSATGQAERFAETHPVHPVGELAAAIERADGVIACSGHGPALLTRALLAEARPVVVDLTSGVDIAADTAGVLGLRIIGLNEIGEHVPPERQEALARARDIVDRATADYLHVERGRMAVPAVTAIRTYVSDIIDREVEAATKRYSPETADAVARSLLRVSNALLHTPSVAATELAQSGSLEDFHRALHTVFGIVVRDS
jgi:glutamyl-tRNA reductase